MHERILLTWEASRLLQEPLGVLGLSVRTTNALEKAGVLRVADLLQCCSRSQDVCEACCVCRQHGGRDADWRPRLHLADLPNFGERTIEEVFTVLRERLCELGALRKG